MFYGALPSPYDIRDYKVKTNNKEILPERFELDFSNIEVKNQGVVSSCAPHAMSTILEYHTKGQYHLSTNFFYGIKRKLFGHNRPGMYMRDLCKLAVEYGDPLVEDCWGNYEVPICCPVAEAAFNNSETMRKAADFKMQSYFICNSIEEIKYALVHYGPVIICMEWYPDYYVKANILTKRGNRKSNGYHALVLYGYDETGFLCQNSWGEIWGNGGRFIIPYEIKIYEARGLVDVNNDTYIAPPNPHPFMNLIFKFINRVANFFLKK